VSSRILLMLLTTLAACATSTPGGWIDLPSDLYFESEQGVARLPPGPCHAEVVKGGLRLRSEDGDQSVVLPAEAVPHGMRLERPFVVARVGDDRCEVALFLPDGSAYEVVGTTSPDRGPARPRELGLVATYTRRAGSAVASRGTEEGTTEGAAGGSLATSDPEGYVMDASGNWVKSSGPTEEDYQPPQSVVRGAFFLPNGRRIGAKGSVLFYADAYGKYLTAYNGYEYYVVVPYCFTVTEWNEAKTEPVSIGGGYRVTARPDRRYGPTRTLRSFPVYRRKHVRDFNFQPTFDPVVVKIWCDWNGVVRAQLKNQGAASPPENSTDHLYVHFDYAYQSRRVAVDALKAAGAEITIDTGYRLARGSKGYVGARVDVLQSFMEFDETNNRKSFWVSR